MFPTCSWWGEVVPASPFSSLATHNFTMFGLLGFPTVSICTIPTFFLVEIKLRLVQTWGFYTSLESCMLFTTCSCDVPFSLLLELTIYPGFAPVPYWETACWCKFQLSSLEVWGFCTSVEESYSCSQQSLTYCVGCAGAQQWAVSEGTGDDRKGTSVPSHLSDWLRDWLEFRRLFFAVVALWLLLAVLNFDGAK